MNKQITMVGGIACVLVLAGAGCMAKNEATVDTSVHTDTQPAQQMEEEQMNDTAMATGTYSVDTEASTVTWFGKRTVGNQHRGTVELSSGQVTVADDAMLTGGRFVVDMSTIEDSEDNERLEAHLRSDDFFAVETYPTAGFAITSATKLEGEGMYEVTGELTIKGITNTVTFEAKIMSETENTVRATATFLVDRAAFDVRYGSGSFFDDLGDSLIEDDMEFTLDLVARMEGATMEEDSMMMEEGETAATSDEDSMMEDEDSDDMNNERPLPTGATDAGFGMDLDSDVEVSL